MKKFLDDLMLLNAYVDGELDASTALAFERRMAKDKKLKAALVRSLALRNALSTQFRAEDVSDGLRRKIEASADIPAGGNLRRFDLRQLAASVVLALAVGSAATLLAKQQLTSPSHFDAIVSGHQRSLLATSPVDVASSDRHNVKPWFDQHLALSPPVPELASEGFELYGGRIDVVEGRPVPTLVYRVHQHLISLVAFPNRVQGNGKIVSQLATQDGYSLITWQAQDFNYSAVSDLALDELQLFVIKWRAASLMQ